MTDTYEEYVIQLDRMNKQLDSMNEAWRAKLMEALQDQELRKWCIEQSLSYELAAEIYNFVTAPLAKLLNDDLKKRAQ